MRRSLRNSSQVISQPYAGALRGAVALSTRVHVPGVALKHTMITWTSSLVAGPLHSTRTACPAQTHTPISTRSSLLQLTAHAVRNALELLYTIGHPARNEHVVPSGSSAPFRGLGSLSCAPPPASCLQCNAGAVQHTAHPPPRRSPLQEQHTYRV